MSRRKRSAACRRPHDPTPHVVGGGLGKGNTGLRIRECDLAETLGKNAGTAGISDVDIEIEGRDSWASGVAVETESVWAPTRGYWRMKSGTLTRSGNFWVPTAGNPDHRSPAANPFAAPAIGTSEDAAKGFDSLEISGVTVQSPKYAAIQVNLHENVRLRGNNFIPGEATIGGVTSVTSGPNNEAVAIVLFGCKRVDIGGNRFSVGAGGRKWKHAYYFQDDAQTADVRVDGNTEELTGAVFYPMTTAVSAQVAYFSVGRFIHANFSSAPGLRAAFQSYVVNGITVLAAVANGTATTTAVRAHNGSDPTNSANIGIQAQADFLIIGGGQTGSAAAKPIRINVGGNQRIELPLDGGMALMSGGAPLLPVGYGGVIYIENGALKYRGSGGTVTTLAPA